MISNAPEFLANFAAAITEADPAAAQMRCLVRDYLMPGWLAEIYRDSPLVNRLRKPVPKAGKKSTSGGTTWVKTRLLGRF